MIEIVIPIEDITNSLLAEVKKGVTQIKNSGITHPVTIGNMYEGLTKTLISSLLSSAFPTVELFVSANSFIRGCHTEFDIIISTQKGNTIPYTKDQFIHDQENVVAVIQVKSKLTYSLIDSAYENLRGVYNLYDHSTMLKDRQKLVKLILNNFVQGKIKELWKTVYGQNFARALFLNENSPLRIIIGYTGYKYVKTLRRNFAKYFDSRKGYVDFGPINWPDTIISGDFTLAKMDGKPLYREISDLSECWWAFYGSTKANPFMVLFAQLREKLAPTYPQIYDYHYLMDNQEIEVASFFYGRSSSDPKANTMTWQLKYTD